MARTTSMRRNRSLSETETPTQGLSGSEIRTIVVRGASGAFAVNVAGVGLAFTVHVLLSRVMGVDQYGIYVYALSWIAILSLFGKLGLDLALLRYVAAYVAQGEWGPLRGILRRAFQSAILAGALISGSGAILVWALRERLGVELTQTFWLAFAVLPVMVLIQLCEPILRACSRIVLARIVENILRPTVLAALVLVAFLGFGWQVQGPTVMALNLVAALAALLLGAVWVRRNLPPAIARVEPDYRMREWMTVALPLFLLSGAQLVLFQTDTIMIGAIMDTREAGIYFVASRISGLVAFGLVAVSAVAGPMIAGLYATGHHVELQHMVTFCARGILLVTIPACVAVIFWGEPILRLFGPAFTHGYPALKILIAGNLAGALAGVVGFLITMTGHQTAAAKITGLGVAINIGLNAALIPTLGIEGAAVATAFTTALWLLLLSRYVWNRLGINSTAFAVRK